MKLAPEQLTQHLKQPLAPAYLLCGDELLLVNEALVEIIQAAKAQGFEERQIHAINNTFKWETLFTQMQNLSLFDNKIILDIRINSNKLTDAIKQGLATLLTLSQPDKLILISMPKLEAASLKAKWFKTLEDNSVFLQFWPITRQQLPAWLNQRLRRVNLSLSGQGIALLAEHTEGNLLAAQQLINRLHLQYEEGKISDAQLMQLLTDAAHIDMYSLTEDILAADGQRISHSLQHLISQGTEPTLVLWLLSRELRAYLALLTAHAQGAELNPIFQAFQIWPKRQAAYRRIFTRHGSTTLLPLTQLTYQADASIKGLNLQNTWDLLHKLCFAMAGLPYLKEEPQ